MLLIKFCQFGSVTGPTSAVLVCGQSCVVDDLPFGKCIDGIQCAISEIGRLFGHFGQNILVYQAQRL